jgi:hypothetical protein
MPRKSSYNESVKNRIVEALQKGHFISEACALAGISTQSFYKWYNLGVEGDARYTDFSDAIDEAQAQAVTDALTDIREAGRDDWRAAAWFLERRSRKWAKNLEVEISGNPEKPVEIELRWADDLGKDKEKKDEFK